MQLCAHSLLSLCSSALCCVASLSSQVVGSADIKVKGVGYTNFNQSLPWYGPNATTGFHVYDSYDLVMPAMEENALFVTTNMCQWKLLHTRASGRRSACKRSDSARSSQPLACVVPVVSLGLLCAAQG